MLALQQLNWTKRSYLGQSNIIIVLPVELSQPTGWLGNLSESAVAQLQVCFEKTGESVFKDTNAEPCTSVLSTNFCPDLATKIKKP